jgi:hypothetical protein
MSETSYTYTTISAGPGDPTRIGVSFYLDSQAVIRMTGAGTDRPFLSLMHGDVWVRINPRTDSLTAADAAPARNLADLAARYADEVERLATPTAKVPAA